MAATQYQIFIRYLNESIGKPLTNKTKVEWVGAEEFIDLTKFYEENKTEYLQIKDKMNNGYTLTDSSGNIIYDDNGNPIIKYLKISDMTQVQVNIYTQCTRYEDLTKRIADDDGTVVQELCTIRSYDDLYQDTNGSKKKAAKQLDLEMYQLIIDESNANNPKYDMIFMYDGIGHITFPGYDGDPTKVNKNPPDNDTTIAPEIYFERMKRIKLDPWFLYATYASLKSVMSKAEELVNILGKDAVKIGKVVPLDQYIEIV